MDLLQLLNWPLKALHLVVVRPAGRLVTGNSIWPDEPPTQR